MDRDLPINPFALMDEESARLIIQLQLDDSKEFQQAHGNGKGKGKARGLTDSQLAAKLYMEDLQSHAAIIHDRTLTRSIAQACQLDGGELAKLVGREQDELKDRNSARQLAGMREERDATGYGATDQVDDKLLAQLSALNVEPETRFAGFDERPVVAESSSAAATRYSYRRCVACQELNRRDECAEAPCGHDYCRACLQALFQASLTDESLFPPRCCRVPIALDSVRRLVGAEVAREYEAKRIEFATPNRTYCSNRACSQFIPPEHILGESAVCACFAVTCTSCKGASHGGDCPADASLQLLLEAARENGWQRCAACHRVVELNMGCNHITCLCGAQFCYECGRAWKTCACEQWDEERLVARANEVIDREGPVPARAGAHGPARGARMLQALDDLRMRHECEHDRWRWIGGRHVCEQCAHVLPSYIFECRGCWVRACNRCRRNRL